MDSDFRLRLKFWGVRGSIATPQTDNLGFGGNTTMPGSSRLSNNGNSHRRCRKHRSCATWGLSLMQEFANQKLSLRILMTHFHWDHIQGIPFFAPLYVPGNEVAFYSEHPAERLRETLEGQMSSPYFPVRFEHMAARRCFEQMSPGSPHRRRHHPRISNESSSRRIGIPH